MTIEIAPPSASVKSAPLAESVVTKEKSGTCEKPKTANPAEFMAILASLGSGVEEELPADGIPLLADGGAVVTDAPTELVTSAPGDTQPQDLTTLLSQALQWLQPSDTLPTDAPAVEAGAVPMVEAVASPVGQVLSAIGLNAAPSPKANIGLNFDVMPDAKPKTNGAGLHTKDQKDPMDTAVLQSLSSTGNVAPTLDGARMEARDAKFTQTELASKMAPSIVEATTPLTIGAVKREEHNSSHRGFQLHAVADATGVTHAGGLLGGGAVPSAMPSSDAAVATTQSYIAEQVSYWISNDVQKAEMKLDGLGDKPVEVSISMNGNQAHVAFRSDEVQARDALENASLQLKEMLQRDGVVLSGMSVGTSAGSDAGTGGRQDRSARQGTKNMVAMVDHPPTRLDGGMMGKNAVGRALDLFV